MFTPLVSAAAGVAAGMVHVVSGPDHLAALAPIALSDRKRALSLGVLWGLGHGMGVVALGGVGLLTRQAFDITQWSAWAELAVGVLLVGLGGWAVKTAAGLEVHSHEHRHGPEGTVHRHAHLHVAHAPHTPAQHGRHNHAAFGVGMLHGAAGVGHLFGVLPALALSTASAVAYLVAYLAGAVLSMGLVGWGLGWLVQRARPAGVRAVMATSGVIAVAVGVAWIGASWPSA